MPDIDPDDLNLFRSAVGDVKPVHHDRHERFLNHPTPIQHSHERDKLETLQALKDDPFSPTDVQPGDPVFYAQSGISREVGRRLKRGLYRIDAELDLHGMRLEEARRSVHEFIREARQRNLGCVHIIHGKGWRSGNAGPVLKPNVTYWLRQLNDVLAFCSSIPADGGTGAVYVLLKHT